MYTVSARCRRDDAVARDAPAADGAIYIYIDERNVVRAAAESTDAILYHNI